MKFEEIAVERIQILLHPKRQDIDPDLGDLAISIKALGLVQPIIISANSDNGYFVIDGKRRLKALHRLDEQYPGEGFDKVECIIHENIDDGYTLKAMSLAANSTKKISKHDLTHTLNDLWNKYCDMKFISRKFGISEKMVRKYVKIWKVAK